MHFSPADFVSDTIQTLTRPAAYFEKMPVDGGFLEPMIKAALYGLVSGAVLCALGMFKLTGVPVLDSPHAAALALLAMPLLVVLLSFVGGALLLVGAMVCKGGAPFQTSVRCMASLMALEPVNLLVDSLSLHGNPVAVGLSVLVAWYGLYLAFHALTKCLAARPKAAIILVIVLAVFNTGNTLLPLLQK